MSTLQTGNEHSMNKVFVFKSILVGFLCFSIFTSGFLLGSGLSSTVEAQAVTSEFLGTPLFSTVKDILDQKFVFWRSSSTLPAAKDFEYGVISGYVSAYKDPYTVFFKPQEAKNFFEDVKGSFGGVGMNVGMKDGNVIVIAPLKDSPAMKAGIKAGDIVAKVNGKSVLGISSDEVITLIRGEIGTTVTITVLHKDAKTTNDIKVVRQEIKIPTLDTEVTNGVFVIKLYNFSSESPELFKKAINDFKASKLTRLIIDLRGNPGGYLDAAVEMASYFLKDGQIVVSERQGKSETIVNHRTGGVTPIAESTKIVVMVDEGSASASEILSGALKDYGVAKVVGVKSFGKGSVQELINLPDGAALKVTIAKWYTPRGINISESGITPDIVVPAATSTPKGYKGVYDAQMLKAIEVVKKM